MLDLHGCVSRPGSVWYERKAIVRREASVTLKHDIVHLSGSVVCERQSHIHTLSKLFLGWTKISFAPTHSFRCFGSSIIKVPHSLYITLVYHSAFSLIPMTLVSAAGSKNKTGSRLLSPAKLKSLVWKDCSGLCCIWGRRRLPWEQQKNCCFPGGDRRVQDRPLICHHNTDSRALIWQQWNSKIASFLSPHFLGRIFCPQKICRKEGSALLY